jgi:hypothetical protein
MTMHRFLQALMVEHNIEMKNVHIIQDSPKHRTQSYVNLALRCNIELDTPMDKAMSSDCFVSGPIRGHCSIQSQNET